MFSRIHPFIALIHLFLLLLQLPRCLFLRFVRACILTCLVDVSSFFFWALFYSVDFLFDAISFVTFECYGIAMTLGLEHILCKVPLLCTTRLSHLFIPREAAFVALYLLVNRMECRLNR